MQRGTFSSIPEPRRVPERAGKVPRCARDDGFGSSADGHRPAREQFEIAAAHRMRLELIQHVLPARVRRPAHIAGAALVGEDQAVALERVAGPARRRYTAREGTDLEPQPRAVWGQAASASGRSGAPAPRRPPRVRDGEAERVADRAGGQPRRSAAGPAGSGGRRRRPTSNRRGGARWTQVATAPEASPRTPRGGAHGVVELVEHAAPCWTASTCRSPRRDRVGRCAALDRCAGGIGIGPGSLSSE